MLASCLLLKKGLIYSNKIILSLKNRDNIFNMKSFKKFQENPRNIKAFTTIELNHELYQTFKS